MGKVEKTEQEVQDWAAWDRQVERDVHAGRLDDLAETALRDHAAGKTTPL